ncbi:reverse transcriptase family protein [Vibrio lentus]
MYIDKPIKNSNESIASIDNLCTALDISRVELDSALSMPMSDRYVTDIVPKSDGTNRHINKPHNLIRKIQRRINKRIFIKLVDWPSYIFGSVPNTYINDELVEAKDYVSCAKQHCECKSLLKLDLKDFFDNIHSDHVYNIFYDFLSYPDDVSRALSNICCKDSNIVQGALTSSYIASLCLWDVEHNLVKRLQRKKLVYTRLVDDISISSKSSKYQFDMIIDHVKSMLSDKDLPLNNKKTKITYTSIEPLLVHGMRVNFKQPRFPADEVRKLRAAVHNIQKLASQPNYRTTFAYRKDFSKCMGRINKLKRTQHEKHQNLVNKLNDIKPLPSRKDLKRCKISFERLEADFKLKGATYWYRKRFYILHDRLNVLQRTFDKTAKEIRKKMKLIKPAYDE